MIDGRRYNKVLDSHKDLVERGQGSKRSLMLLVHYCIMGFYVSSIRCEIQRFLAFSYGRLAS